MDITITPGKLCGTVQAIPSKSQAHRLLICAAFADSPTTLICPETNQDIEATADCLRAIGADIRASDNGYFITPVKKLPLSAHCYCGESGSTLRFLLPVVGALGIETTFHLSGRLPSRPLSPLWEEMERMGCRLSKPTDNTVLCSGKLTPGSYSISGEVSSQFVSGLLFAISLLPDESVLEITGKIESAPYIEMTKQCLCLFGSEHRSPGSIHVEGDWSNAAFFLAANAMGSPVSVDNLNYESIQGDRAVLDLLSSLHDHIVICAADIPDLVPILSIVAAANKGAVFTDIRRLRFKESDRVKAVVAMIRNLGGQAFADDNTLTVLGTGLVGGCVDSQNDHRIAMSAAIAATVCTANVTILGAQCVNKSYPAFWDEYTRLGGKYEFDLR